MPLKIFIRKRVSARKAIVKALEKEKSENSKRRDRYHERETQCKGKINYVCFECRKTFKLPFGRNLFGEKVVICPTCGKIENVHQLGTVARAPRKDASNKKWKEFEKFTHWDWFKKRRSPA